MERRDEPTVSVIVPCHNHGTYLPEALASVESQTFDSWEVLVVDDGSTDDSAKIASALVDALGDRARFISQVQSGPSAARNAAARAARGTYLLPLDADDRLLPAMLERTVAALDVESSAAIAYPRYRYFGERTGVLLSQPFDPDRLCFRNYIPSTSLIRKEVFDRVGGYDEAMRQGYEDWELWVSIVEAGWRGTLVPEVLFEYRIHGRSLNVAADERRDELTRLIARKHPQFFSRRRRAVGLLKRLPAALGGRLSRWLP